MTTVRQDTVGSQSMLAESGHDDEDRSKPARGARSSNAEDYLYAKRKLKKAALEHYR